MPARAGQNAQRFRRMSPLWRIAFGIRPTSSSAVYPGKPPAKRGGACKQCRLLGRAKFIWRPGAASPGLLRSCEPMRASAGIVGTLRELAAPAGRLRAPTIPCGMPIRRTWRRRRSDQTAPCPANPRPAPLLSSPSRPASALPPPPAESLDGQAADAFTGHGLPLSPRRPAACRRPLRLRTSGVWRKPV
jgi:hypothetical protein